MRRRTLIGSLGSAILMPPPLAAVAQQRTAMPVIGFLGLTSPEVSAATLAAFLTSLKDGGYVVGRNVAIEYRWAHGTESLLPAYAAELVALRPAVIIAPNISSTLAARAATQNIPVVFMCGRPVELGLVASYNRPGGNATGVDILISELVPKRLELVRDLVPGAKTIAYFSSPDWGSAAAERASVEAAARASGYGLLLDEVRTAGEIEQAFERFATRRPDALVPSTAPLFFVQRHLLIALAARHAIPAIYEWPDTPSAGGLISLGPSRTEPNRILGNYAVRILGGAKPADLPVQRLSKLELVINLRTARALGLPVPSTLLNRADEVIE